MFKLFPMASLSAVFALGVLLSGCPNQQPAAPPEAAQEKSAATDHEGHADEPGDSAKDDQAPEQAEPTAATDSGQYEDALAGLSPADRELAEKQKVCPVSGEPLGSMGKPYKVTVQDREVFLCCAGCESKIKADPEKYLAKLSE